MNYIFYDFETSGSNKDFDQILQIGAVLVNDGFQIKDKMDISCRLKKNIIPAPEALLINKISIDQLQSNKVSHYHLVEQLRQKFEEWSPACFVEFNSIGFDEDVLRQGLFQSFNFPYLTSAKGNTRLDVLKLARAVSAFAPNSIAVPLNENNKPSFKLKNLTRVNQIAHDNAHDAMGDVIATLELAKKIKDKAGEVWDALLIYKKGDDIGKNFFNEDFVCYQDLIFGKLYNFAATFVCFHPVYGKSWLCAFDLKHDPRLLFDLRLSELKQTLFSTPTKIRHISLNKMPVVLSKENFSALEDYNNFFITLKNYEALLLSRYKLYEKTFNSNLHLNFYERIHSLNSHSLSTSIYFKSILPSENDTDKFKFFIAPTIEIPDIPLAKLLLVKPSITEL